MWFLGEEQFLQCDMGGLNRPQLLVMVQLEDKAFSELSYKLFDCDWFALQG